MSIAWLRPVLWMVFALSSLGRAQETSQVVSERGLIDHGFRFRIEAPDDTWKVLPEADARKVVPDAVAGLVKTPTIFCVVVVERAGEGHVESWARTIVDALPLEDRDEEAFEKTTFRDRPAVRVQSRGRTQGVAVRFQHLVFLNEGYLYQIVTWGVANLTQADGRSFRPAVEAITMLEGQVLGRADERKLKDTHGVGWQVRSGRFAHAAYGFAVEPSDEWRIVLGDELAQMNSDASVGLAHENEDAYFILLSERASGVDRVEFEKMLRRNIAEENEALPDPVTMDIASVSVTLDRYRLPQGMTLLHGVLVRGDIYHQLQAWFHASRSEPALRALAGAFSAVRFLEAEERERLRQEIASAPDLTNRVGPTHSFRQGVYRDFGNAFSWKRPAGTWRVMVGDEARLENPSCCLYLEELEAGLLAQVIVEEIEGAAGESYHEEVIEGLAEGGTVQEKSETVEDELGGVKAWTTRLRLDLAGIPFTYTATTTVTSKHTYQLLVWGTAGNVAASPGTSRLLRRGFELHPRGLSPVVQEDGEHVDVRVGFALASPAKDIEFSSVMPDPAQAIGSAILCEHEGEFCIVVGVCGISDQQDAAWFQDFVMSSIIARLQEGFGNEFEESREELAGLPCRRLTWRRKSGELFVCFSLQRDRTFYAYAVSGREEAAIAAAKQRFRLLP